MVVHSIQMTELNSEIFFFFHEENNYTDVIPNDDLFPFGSINDMVNDVYSSI